MDRFQRHFGMGCRSPEVRKLPHAGHSTLYSPTDSPLGSSSTCSSRRTKILFGFAASSQTSPSSSDQLDQCGFVTPVYAPDVSDILSSSSGVSSMSNDSSHVSSDELFPLGCIRSPEVDETIELYRGAIERSVWKRFTRMVAMVVTVVPGLDLFPCVSVKIIDPCGLSLIIPCRRYPKLFDGALWAA